MNRITIDRTVRIARPERERLAFPLLLSAALHALTRTFRQRAARRRGWA